jgi:hypothetical protein
MRSNLTTRILSGAIVLAASQMEARIATAGVTVTPTAITMTATVNKYKYRMVTLSNSSPSYETLVGGDATIPEFWPTWGGTCNNLIYAGVIPPGKSCTLQWGFKPSTKGLVTGIGNIMLKSGSTIHLFLNGIRK